ncbi:MAG: hypothetical protein WBR26_13245 [Candidatus Acidiferrum sp.]
MKTIQFVVAKKRPHTMVPYSKALSCTVSRVVGKSSLGQKKCDPSRTQKERGTNIPMVNLQSFVATSVADMVTPRDGKLYWRHATSLELNSNEEVVSVLAALFQSNENT